MVFSLQLLSFSIMVMPLSPHMPFESGTFIHLNKSGEVGAFISKYLLGIPISKVWIIY